MNIGDLIRDPADGKASHTKLWNNVAQAIVAATIGWQAWRGTVSDDLLLWYLAIAGGVAVGSKMTGLTFGKGKA